MEVSQPPDYYFEAYFKRRYLAHYVHQNRIDKVISLVTTGSHVLDAGCGSGIVPYLLATRKDCTVVGIDIRSECVEFASKRVTGFEFYQGDIRDFSLDGKFDVVLCTEVLEHFVSADQIKGLNNLDSHLKSDGLLILTFPSKFYFFIEPIWTLIRKVRHPAMVFDDEEHHDSIPPSQIIDLLREKGYVLEQSKLSGLGLINLVAARKK